MRGPPAVLVQVDALLLAPLFEQGPKVLFHATLHLVGQDDLVGDVEVAKLVLVVDAVAVLVPLGHALAYNGLDLAALRHLAALAA